MSQTDTRRETLCVWRTSSAHSSLHWRSPSVGMCVLLCVICGLCSFLCGLCKCAIWIVCSEGYSTSGRERARHFWTSQEQSSQWWMSPKNSSIFYSDFFIINFYQSPFVFQDMRTCRYRSAININTLQKRKWRSGRMRCAFLSFIRIPFTHTFHFLRAMTICFSPWMKASASMWSGSLLWRRCWIGIIGSGRSGINMKDRKRKLQKKNGGVSFFVGVFQCRNST